MGVDIHVRVTKYDEKTNLYREISLFVKRRPEEKYHPGTPDFVRVDPYSGRNYEMFEGMKDGDDTDGFGFFPWTGIKLNSYEEDFRNEIKEKMSSCGYYDFYEISLIEMENYLLKHPTVVDYDSELWAICDTVPNPKPMKENPIKDLYDDIHNYIYFAEDGWVNSFSDYKIVFYFDC